MADVNIADNDLLSLEGLDKVEEYFKAKDILRVLRNDLKDLKSQIPEMEEYEKISKRLSDLKLLINDDESIKALKEKISTTRERQELLKELIRIDMLEKAQEEIKRNGKKLKLVSNLKEMKDGERSTKRKFFRK